MFPSGSLIPPYYPPSGCHLGVPVETRGGPSVIAVDPDDVDQLVNVLLAHVIEHDVIHVEEVSDGLILKPGSVAGLFDDVAQGGQTFAEQQWGQSIASFMLHSRVSCTSKVASGMVFHSLIGVLYEGFLQSCRSSAGFRIHGPFVCFSLQSRATVLFLPIDYVCKVFMQFSFSVDCFL